MKVMQCVLPLPKNPPSVSDWAVFSARKRFTLWNDFHLEPVVQFLTCKEPAAVRRWRGRHCTGCKMFCHKQTRQRVSVLVDTDFTAGKRFTPWEHFHQVAQLRGPRLPRHCGTFCHCSFTRRCGTLPLDVCQRKQHFAHPGQHSACRSLNLQWANRTGYKVSGQHPWHHFLFSMSPCLLDTRNRRKERNNPCGALLCPLLMRKCRPIKLLQHQGRGHLG